MNPSGSLVVGRFLGTVTVTLHGDLDLTASVELAGVLRDLIDGQGNLAVVVDLRNVGRIDGSGVDVLASAADRIATRGGELRLGGAATIPHPAGSGRYRREEKGDTS